MPETEGKTGWPETVDGLLEHAWLVIVNVGQGDWSQMPKDWQEAAEKWRTKYLARVRRPAFEEIAPPSDSGELERALENFGKAYWRMEEEQFNGVSEYQTARRSVLALFERLQNRIAELERSTSGA